MTDAIANARIEGAVAERKRIHAIMSLPEVKGREAVAIALALQSSISPATAKETLAGIPLTVAERYDGGRHEVIGLCLGDATVNVPADGAIGFAVDAHAGYSEVMSADQVADKINAAVKSGEIK